MRSLGEFVQDVKDRISRKQAYEADIFLRVFSGEGTRDDGQMVLSILKRELDIQNGYDGGPIEAIEMAVIHGEANAFRKIMNAIRIARAVRRGDIQIMEDEENGNVRFGHNLDDSE